MLAVVEPSYSRLTLDQLTPPPEIDLTPTVSWVFPNNSTRASPGVTFAGNLTVSEDPDTVSDEEFCTSVIAAGASAGEVAVMVVSLLTLNDAAGVEPKSTPVAPVKPLPLTVTEAPPAVDPE
jgi:hypothetical protein